MRLGRFFYSPDGGTSADSATAALDHTFGPLSRVEPGLAASEEKERGAQKTGAPAKAGLELGRPMLDSELPPPQIEEPKIEAPDPAPQETPGDGEKPSGSDPESPDEDTAALDAILAKYQGKPRSLAQAYREIQGSQTRTAEEKKALQAQLDSVAEVIDRDYEWVEGKPVLKTDVAARHLRAQRGTETEAPPAFPTQEQVRAQVEEEFRNDGLEIFDETQIPAFLAKMKGTIDKVAAERFQIARTQYEAQLYAMQAAVGDMVNRHLAAHPEHKDLLPVIDQFYAGIPERARTVALLENWLPLPRIAELLHTERSVKQMVTDAYNLGKKARGQAATVTDSGSPGRSRPTPPNGRGTSADAVRTMKDRVVGGSGLPSIDTIFAK